MFTELLILQARKAQDAIAISDLKGNSFLLTTFPSRGWNMVRVSAHVVWIKLLIFVLQNNAFC